MILGRQAERGKETCYLLNPEHPVGGPKAQWFEQALGYTRENASDLANQLVFRESEAVQTAVTEHGTKFNQTINVVGANGKTIPITTAWIRGSDGVVDWLRQSPENRFMLQECAVVRLKRVVRTIPLRQGTKRAVLIAYVSDPPVYEVEFVDETGKSLGTYTVEEADLEEVKKD